MQEANFVGPAAAVRLSSALNQAAIFNKPDKANAERSQCFVLAHAAALKNAEVLAEMGKVWEAAARRSDVLLFAHHAWGPSSLEEKCEAQYQVALNLYDRSIMEAALLSFIEALTLCRKLPEGNHYLLANILVGIGNTQKARNLTSQALSCYQQAIEILEEKRHASNEDPSALCCLLVNTALVYMQEGQMATAEHKLGIAAKHCTSIIGSAKGKMIAADIWHNKSCCLFARKEAKEAILAMRRTLKLRTSQLGERHLLTADANHELGNMLPLENSKILDEVLKLLGKAQIVRLHTLGASHPDTLETHISLQRVQQRKNAPGFRGDTLTLSRRREPSLLEGKG
eukprot:CAMPEP_0173114102 /NCGR_PEP_ID=MMETSP1102-20130122/47383_1 /TAXON_ID=49646 /ORGANISM="Geminigera sp., Strain Caron Lab Isolate" /LENGTH=341 /DNA_ID=CAMNT_0014016239 /DNA_START=48 /DNA_END=1073 /DNA_ORIENTATION=+